MLSDDLIVNGIILDPSNKNKWHVLEIMTRYYCKSLHSSQCDKIFSSILHREMSVSTGLGGGVALPHARTDFVDSTKVLFVRFKKGIEWHSMDGLLVNFLFLIIGPRTSTKEYLDVLSNISKMLSRKNNRSLLLKAKTTKDILSIFSEVKDRKYLR